MARTSSEILRQYGITYRQLDHWARQGYLSDDGRPESGTGSGYDREFGHRAVRRIDVMSRLVGIGLKPVKAAEFARLLEASPTGERSITLPGNITLTIGT